MATNKALEERIAALETAFAERRTQFNALVSEHRALRAECDALKAKTASRGPWRPSQQYEDTKAEYLRRRAAGERVVVRGGKCVPVDAPTEPVNHDLSEEFPF